MIGNEILRKKAESKINLFHRLAQLKFPRNFY